MTTTEYIKLGLSLESCDTESDKETFVKKVYEALHPTRDFDTYIAENWKELGFSPRYAAENFDYSDIHEVFMELTKEFENDPENADLTAIDYCIKFDRALEKVLNAA